MTEQQQGNLNRVNQNISGLVQEFVETRWQSGEHRFHMRDLHDFIFQRTQIAPASPDRILRQLRLKGKCDYRVVDRASCYLITRVGLAA